MRILSLDLGKFKTVFLNYLCGGGAAAVGSEYGKIASTPEAIHDLLVDREPDRVIVEAGSASG